MIDDLSRTLRAILSQKGLPPELAVAQIVFDHPEETFNPQQTTINLFLYDIREDLELRSNEPVVERRDGQVITHHAPMRVGCSYLVTAWPVGGGELALQEHRLLGQVLQVLSRLPVIPKAFLQGSLARQSAPVPMVTALVDSQKNLSEFWTALGSHLRPSLTVTATIAIDLLPSEVAVPVSSADLKVGERTAPDQQELHPSTMEEFIRTGLHGRIVDGQNKPMSEVPVSISELSLNTQTDADGVYRLVVERPGTYTLRASKHGRTSEKRITIPSQGEINLELK